MATNRYDAVAERPGTLSTGYESATGDSSFAPPTCGIEDVDRAFFELFESQLPFFFRHPKTGETARVPVSFGAGERFVQASKVEPIRDRNGAIILPVISIARSSVAQEAGRHAGANDRYNELVVKRSLSADDPLYQLVRNTADMKSAQFSGYTGVPPATFYTRSGRHLRPTLHRNIEEITVIPMPKRFLVKYEVVLWAQYIQHANDFLMSMMGSYLQPGSRNIRLDTKKGYWFVAYFDEEVQQEDNFSDFSDSERIFKVTLTAEVPGFIVLPSAPGVPSGAKKYLSSPEVSFASAPIDDMPDTAGTVSSADPGAYMLSDVETVDVATVPGSIGFDGRTVSLMKAGDPVASAPVSPVITATLGSSATVGKTSRLKTRKKTVRLEFNPTTGEREHIVAHVVSSNPSKGEEVLTVDSVSLLQ